MFNVKVIGEQFAWAFGATADPVTGASVPFATTHDLIRDALRAEGFPEKIERRLPNRHAFVRALNDWVESQVGGKVNHKISDVLDSNISDDKTTLKIQIDDKIVETMTDAQGKETPIGVKFSTRCWVHLDKSTGAVRSNDLATENMIRATLAYHTQARTATDVGRVIHRLMRDELGIAGLIPWNGRGTYLVLAPYLPVLDRVCDVVARLGGTVTRQQQYHISPAPQVAPAPTPSNPNPAAPPVVPQSGPIPVGNQADVAQVLLTFIQETMGELQRDVEAHYRMTWAREGSRAGAVRKLYERVKQAAAALQLGESLLSPLPYEWEHFNALMSDWIVGIKNAVDRCESGNVVPVPSDPTAPVVAQVEPVAPVVAPEPVAPVSEEPADEPKDFRDGVIHWGAIVVAPPANTATDAPKPGSIDAEGNYVPKNPIAYQDYLRFVAESESAA